MPEGLITVAYIVSGVLFILSLRGLSNQETAKRGNLYGAAGMIIAVLATILGGRVGSLGTLMLVMLVGGGIGMFAARRVAMTAMPIINKRYMSCSSAAPFTNHTPNNTLINTSDKSK